MFPLRPTSLSCALLGYIVSALANAFYPAEFWRYPMLIAVFILATTFSQAKPSTKLLSMILTAIGAYFLVSSNATFTDWSKALIDNSGIISLLLTVPMLGIILRYRPYQAYLAAMMPKYIHSPFRFYGITSLVVSALSMLLNLGAVPFIHQFFGQFAEKYPRQVYHKALMRAFCPNAMWSPSYISIAIVLRYVPIPWHSIAPMGITVTAAGIVIAWILGWWEYGRSPAGLIETTQSEAAVEYAGNNILVLLAVQMASLIGLIVALEYSTGKSALVIVPIVAFTAPLIFAGLFKRLNCFAAGFQEYVSVRLPSMANEFLLFTAIGFFGYALGVSEAREYIQIALRYLTVTQPFWMILLLITVISGVSIFGIHPNISISAIAVTLSPASIGLTELQLAGAMLAGYSIYNLLSPFAGVPLVVAAITKAEPLTISLRQNGSFSLLFALAAAAILV